MTNSTLNPTGESTPLVTEDYIVDTIQRKSTPQPRAKSYGDFPAEWIEDVEAIDLVMEVRDKYEAALATLLQENGRLAAQVEQMRAQLEAEQRRQSGKTSEGGNSK